MNTSAREGVMNTSLRLSAYLLPFYFLSVFSLLLSKSSGRVGARVSGREVLRLWPRRVTLAIIIGTSININIHIIILLIIPILVLVLVLVLVVILILIQVLVLVLVLIIIVIH